MEEVFRPCGCDQDLTIALDLRMHALKEVFRPCGCDQGFPIALDLRMHAAIPSDECAEVLWLIITEIEANEGPAGNRAGIPGIRFAGR